MDDLVSQGCRNSERTTIDERARSGSCETASVANVAAAGVEKRIASGGGGRNGILPARSARCGHEVGKSQNVVAIIFRIRDRIERRRERHVNDTLSRAGRVFVRSRISGARATSAETVKRVGDTYFIEIGVARERNQTCLLSFPAEPADAQGVVGLC